MDDLGHRAVEAFRSLPQRYLGAPPGFDATYCIRLGDIGRSWEVRCTAIGARVRAGASKREPDVVIGTDAHTWLQLREGEINGVELEPSVRVGHLAPAPRGRDQRRGGVLAAPPVRARRP